LPTKRGTSNSNSRGSSKDRKARRQYLLSKFGDGKTAPCVYCGEPLTDATITVDRIVPGCQGGKYIRSNIQPACGLCNSKDGNLIKQGKRLDISCGLESLVSSS